MIVGVAAIEETSWPCVHEDATSRWSERRGLRLVVFDELGHRGTGVAAPLLGYAPDDLVAAQEDLERFTSFECDAEAVRLWLPARLAAFSTPSATFAIETAILELAAARTGRSVLDLLGGAPRVWSAAKLVDPLDPTAAARAVADGYETLKIKIGRPGRLNEELAAIRRAAEVATVRVDANGTLGPESAPAVDTLPVELIEEPGFDTRLPVALDESLLDPAFEALLAKDNVVAVVLKPMVLGGLMRCLSMADRARRHGVEAIASHTFDGPIGDAANTRLAHLLPPTRFAHGVPS